MTTRLATSRTEHAAQLSCNTCTMRAHCMKAGVEKEHDSDFQDARLDIRILRKGQHLFRIGDDFDGIFVVRSGAVKTTIISEDGTEQVSGFYLPGEICGLDGIDTGYYGSNAVSLETSSICVYPFETLMRLAQRSAGLQHQMFQHASREIATRQRMLLTMGHRSAEARIAEFLVSLSERFKRIGYSASSFHLPMSRQDIADYLGLSVETVCRVLTRFQKAGTIQREQREITLKDFDALAALSIGTLELRPSRGAAHGSVAASGRRFSDYAIAAG